MYGKGLICVPDLEVQLPEAWQSNSAYLVKEQAGKLARMSDVDGYSTGRRGFFQEKGYICITAGFV